MALGSLQRAFAQLADRVRITARLIEAETGGQLWSERYDRDPADLFDLQDEVARMIASALAVRLELEDLTKAKRKPPESMRAYDYWLRGKKCLDLWTPEANAEARRLFAKAIESDPEYARGYAGLAFTYAWGAYYSAWDADSASSSESARQYAERAVALDDTDHLPHVTLGWVHHERGEFEQAEAHFARASFINPNDADTIMNRAMVSALEGKSDAALEMAHFAIRLNPRHPDWYFAYLGGCYYRAHKFADAVATWERAPDAVPEVRGTLDRPALQRLLTDIRAGKVQIVVVYKVDRLTRSLADFAKLIELFDAHGVSFVSVTQQFNTTTSMGRLMLNVLLSFAQFEREVTGERIRDKIAASKKKGLWMGGTPPLGYDVRDRKLVVNEAEAELVRHIFRRYVQLGTVAKLMVALAAEGHRTKRYTSTTGGTFGGRAFSRGHLYSILSNRIYRGEIVHKDAAYPGEHQAIVEPVLWDRVQNLLAANHHSARTDERVASPALLKGLIFDGAGNRMSPSHAVRGVVIVCTVLQIWA